MTASSADYEYMARALQLARLGLMTTHPNPRVGCVIVKEGEVIGEGWHEVAGGPHAEIMALDNAGADAKGATAYVTLEPCSHHGKTPPCADALINAGVARVVSAMTDPNPAVSGRGLDKLRDAGIAVTEGIMSAEAELLNRGFCKRMRSGKPWMSLKLAMTLDGRTAAADGSSQWITGDAARADVHRLRAEAGVVLTGIESVLADDSRLNVRLDHVDSSPLRVVLDSQLRMPLDAAMLGLDGRTVILSCSRDEEKTKALEQSGAEVAVLASDQGRVDLHAALDWLSENECNEVLVETGATLAGALVAEGLVDELVCYLAPKLLGDAGRGLLRLPGLEKISQTVDLEIQDVRAIGKDWCITAKPVPAVRK